MAVRSVNGIHPSTLLNRKHLARRDTVKAIINTKLITTEGIIWNGALTFENERIVEVGWRGQVDIPEDAEIIDARGKYTAPGFVDIHCHGAGDCNFHEDPLQCCQHFIAHGTTTVLPTLYHNLSLEEMIDAARIIREHSLEGIGRIMEGLYMEGPYMNGIGSFQNGIKWHGPICSNDFQPLVDALGDMARVWAIDPARENIDTFMAYVKEVNPKAIFALGHSNATFSQCKRIAHYGVCLQTHHGDSGKAKGLAQGTIGAGCDEYTLYNPEMYAEVICDEVGVHVDPDMIKLVIHIKGEERIILISDSMCDKGKYKNNAAAGIAYGPDLNYDDAGYLAGSHLTIDNACRNLMKHTAYGLCHAIRFATYNPARLLGIDDRVGSLAPGKYANLLIMDDDVHIIQVFLRGNAVL